MNELTPMFEGPGPENVYHEALKAGKFQIQRCGGCARHVFFPRVVCPHCGSPELSWVTPSGNGTVYSTIVVRRKPDAGGDLNVALIDLDEGVRMMSRVEGLPPEQVKIGMAVKARVIDGKDQPLVVFTPAGGAQ
jgi:uncharacterized protein